MTSCLRLSKQAPLLILDGIEAHASTAWAQEKLYQLLNSRYLSQLPTVITTRVELEEIDPRIATRAADPRFGGPLRIDAPSYHQAKRPRTEAPPPRRKSSRETSEG
jgi:DNA replication protein DnaC